MSNFALENTPSVIDSGEAKVSPDVEPTRELPQHVAYLSSVQKEQSKIAARPGYQVACSSAWPLADSLVREYSKLRTDSKNSNESSSGSKRAIHDEIIDAILFDRETTPEVKKILDSISQLLFSMDEYTEEMTLAALSYMGLKNVPMEEVFLAGSMEKWRKQDADKKLKEKEDRELAKKSLSNTREQAKAFREAFNSSGVVQKVEEILRQGYKIGNMAYLDDSADEPCIVFGSLDDELLPAVHYLSGISIIDYMREQGNPQQLAIVLGAHMSGTGIVVKIGPDIATVFVKAD